MNNSTKRTGLIGHPFAPIEIGEHFRTTFRALEKVCEHSSITDVYKSTQPNEYESKEFSSVCTDSPSAINIFHINGNEVGQDLKHLSIKREWKGYNIIYPLWDVEKWPEELANQLDKFDEIWAPSKFIYEGLNRACNKSVIHMPLACEIVLNTFLGRRYFGLSESNYTFFCFYDLRSYSSRKNPDAVIKAFRSLLALRPFSKIHLVIKVNDLDANPKIFNNLFGTLEDIRSNVTVFQRTMGSNEVKNLLRCCDCFVSLHRSEGYGFEIAEAMSLGKPVIATAYSGNMDFMEPNFAYGVNFNLIPIKDGEYPFFENQVWADPDWKEASLHMLNLVDNPNKGRIIGKFANTHMRSNFSYRAAGLRYVNRLDEIEKFHVISK